MRWLWALSGLQGVLWVPCRPDLRRSAFSVEFRAPSSASRNGQRQLKMFRQPIFVIARTSSKSSPSVEIFDF